MTGLAAGQLPDERFDLKAAISPDACRPGADGEIVVCAKPRDDAKHRLAPNATLGPVFDEKPLRAETGILGGAASLGIVGETVMVGGAPSNRMMFRLKTKF